jgi:hypothetical protein
VTATYDFVTSNFENNGGGDPAKWQAGHEFLASLRAHAILRQEVWDALDNDGALAKRAETVLGMHGWIGAGSSTAVYTDPDVFASDDGWDERGWQLAPTARMLRLREAGDALPIVAVSHHLTYSSVTARAIEAEHLTRFLDKDVIAKARKRVKLPTVLGGDRNSYRVPGRGEPPLPPIDSIADLPHRTHRSRPGPGGVRIPDTYPDQVMRAAGAEDAARHVARAFGRPSALAPTTLGKRSQGPPAAVDGFWVSTVLLPALVDVDVIDMTGLSDHHAVRARFDRTILVNILRAGTPAHRRTPDHNPDRTQDGTS